MIETYCVLLEEGISTPVSEVIKHLYYKEM